MEPLEILKKLYKENFDIDEELVELMSNRDILHLTASGSSIKSISNFLDIDEKEIEEVNKNFYGFEGFALNLDINPLLIFNNMTRMGYWDFETFLHEVSTISPYASEDTIHHYYKVCVKFCAIEKLLEEKWN